MKWNLFTLVQINTLEWIMYKPLLSFLFLNIILHLYYLHCGDQKTLGNSLSASAVLVQGIKCRSDE